MSMRAERQRAHREGGHGSRESGKDENDEYALTVARLALRLCQEIERNTAQQLASWRRQWCCGVGARQWWSGVVDRRRGQLRCEREREQQKEK